MSERQIARVVTGKPSPEVEQPSEQPHSEFDPSINITKLSAEIIAKTIAGSAPVALWLVWYVASFTSSTLDSHEKGWLVLLLPMALAVAGGIYVAFLLAFIPWLLARNPVAWVLGLAWFLFVTFLLRKFLVSSEIFFRLNAVSKQYDDLSNVVVGGPTAWFVFLAVAAQIYNHTSRKSLNVEVPNES